MDEGPLGNFLSGMETLPLPATCSAGRPLETSLVEWKLDGHVRIPDGELRPWKLP